MRGGITVDVDAIRVLCMAHLANSFIVLPAPEKGYRRKALPSPEDVPCASDALALGEHQIGADIFARQQCYAIRFDPRDGRPEMEDDPMRLVKRFDHVAERRASTRSM